MSAITYFLNQTRYYASLIRCSVRQVFESMGKWLELTVWKAP